MQRLWIYRDCGDPQERPNITHHGPKSLKGNESLAIILLGLERRWLSLSRPYSSVSIASTLITVKTRRRTYAVSDAKPPPLPHSGGGVLEVGGEAE